MGENEERIQELQAKIRILTGQIDHYKEVRDHLSLPDTRQWYITEIDKSENELKELKSELSSLQN